MPEVSFACGEQFGCFYRMDLDAISSLPMAKVRVDFHFIKSSGNQFHCDPMGDPQYYAPDYVKQLLISVNDCFTNPTKDGSNISPQLPDTRIRVEPFGNPGDLCDVIFFHDQEPATFANTGAYHVIIFDYPAGQISGSACNTKVYLYNWHKAIFQDGWTDVSLWGPTLGHEIGHRFGLCHSFAAENTCPDLNPGADCGGPAPDCDNPSCPGIPPGSALPNACGGNTNFCCYCTYGASNNLMGANSGGDECALTKAQWSQMYGQMRSAPPAFVYFDLPDCPDPSGLPEIEISGPVPVVWDGLKLINQDVRVKTGATLIINCEVWMGQDKSILVERGARLFVQNGKITGWSPECRWLGIYVAGNNMMDQPSVADAQNTNVALNPNGAGVAYITGAIIENAAIGVAAKASSSATTPESHFGGLIMCESSDFINNGKAVEFMRYYPTNKSYFNSIEIMRIGTPPYHVSFGVSIWACKGIKFDATNFTSLSQYGIQSFNAPFEISNSTLDQVNYGLRIEATMPGLSQGDLIVEKNIFKNNRYDIYCNAGVNSVYRYLIKNDNRFFDGITPAIGIRISGESRFEIGGLDVTPNIFNDKAASVSLISTGSYRNYVRCNIFDNHKPYGVGANYKNSNLEILTNEFLGTSASATNGIEILVNGSVNAPGEIGFLQGTSGEGAGNCYAQPENAVVVPQSNTVEFLYYVLNQQDPDFDPCLRPTGSETDGGNWNYKIFPSQANSDCSFENPPAPATENDLLLARQNTAATYAIWQADPGNAGKHGDYYLASVHQDECLRSLARAAYEANDLDRVEYLLLGENSQPARRGIVGLRASRKDFAGAQAMLAAMPVYEQDDQWFKDVMAISIAVEQSPLAFILSPQQEELLHTVAAAEHSIVRGYACALLSWLKGYTCEEALPEEGHGEERTAATNTAYRQVKLYPNPVSGLLTVECPECAGYPVRIELTDPLGRTVYKGADAPGVAFSVPTASLPNGVYIVRLFQADSLIYTGKISVAH